MGVNLMLENVPEELAKRLLNDKRAEVAFRNAKKRFEQMNKYKVKLLDKAKNAQSAGSVLPGVEIALEAVNIAATVAGIVIICGKLKKIDQKIDGIRKELKDQNLLLFDTQIASPSRELVSDYKVLSGKLKKGVPVSEEELMALIRGSKKILDSLLNLRGSVSMDNLLNLVFTLLPILASCIMLYYQRFYDVNDGAYSLHEEWMEIFETLLSEEFRDEVQDYLFIEKGRSNREANEYLGYLRKIVSGYKEQIDQLVQDLKECDGVEGYEDAMLWSRQYVLQQARSQQAELEAEVGAEKAQEIMEEALAQAGV